MTWRCACTHLAASCGQAVAEPDACVTQLQLGLKAQLDMLELVSQQTCEALFAQCLTCDGAQFVRWLVTVVFFGFRSAAARVALVELARSHSS